MRATAEAAAVEHHWISESMERSGYVGPGPQAGNSGGLIVRLPVVKRRKGSRTRISRSLSKKVGVLLKLKNPFQVLKKHKTLRSFQRLNKKQANQITWITTKWNGETNRRSRAQQGRKVRRQLLQENAMLEVRLATVGCDRRGRKALNNIVAGRIVRQCRCNSLVSSRTGTRDKQVTENAGKDYGNKEQERFRRKRRYRGSGHISITAVYYKSM